MTYVALQLYNSSAAAARSLSRTNGNAYTFHLHLPFRVNFYGDRRVNIGKTSVKMSYLLHAPYGAVFELDGSKLVRVDGELVEAEAEPPGECMQQLQYCTIQNPQHHCGWKPSMTFLRGGEGCSWWWCSRCCRDRSATAVVDTAYRSRFEAEGMLDAATFVYDTSSSLETGTATEKHRRS